MESEGTRPNIRFIPIIEVIGSYFRLHCSDVFVQCFVAADAIFFRVCLVFFSSFFSKTFNPDLSLRGEALLRVPL